MAGASGGTPGPLAHPCPPGSAREVPLFSARAQRGTITGHRFQGDMEAGRGWDTRLGATVR